jgi:hypothetical protein
VFLVWEDAARVVSADLLVVQLFSQDHTGMAKQTDEAAHVIRTDLIRNQRGNDLRIYRIPGADNIFALAFLHPGLEAERAAVIDEKLPRTSGEWQCRCRETFQNPALIPG